MRRVGLPIAIRGRQKRLQPLGDFVRFRPIEVLRQQIAQHRRRRGIGADQLRHLAGRFLAPRRERGPGLDGQVVFAP